MWPFRPRQSVPASDAGLPFQVDGEDLLIARAALDRQGSRPGRQTAPDSATLRASVLEQWLEEDRVIDLGESLLLTPDAWFTADPDDRAVLGLGKPHPFRTHLRARGSLSGPDFSLTLELVPPPGNSALGWRRESIFLSDGSERYLLDAATYAVFRAVETFKDRTPDERTHDTQLAAIARIRELAVAAGTHLDGYLQDEEAIVPTQITIRLQTTEDGGLLLDPDIEGIESDELVEGLDRHRHDVPAVVTLSGSKGQKRRRVVLSDTLRAGARQVRKWRRLDAREAEHFLQAPEQFIDPDLVNLDDLGARVLGIGRAPSTMHPLVAREPRSWTPSEVSLVLRRLDGESLTVPLQRPEDLDPLESALEEARAQGVPTFTYEGHRLPATAGTAEQLQTLRQAVEELNRMPEAEAEEPERPKEEAPEDEPGGPKVLIVKDNLEDVEYVEGGGLDHRSTSEMEPVPGLLPGVELLPHQKRGIAWLQEATRAGKPGVLLADDMGLGKTLQVLAFWRWYLANRQGTGPMLVIAPVALLENWEAEARKFLSVEVLEVLALHGSGIDRVRHPGTAGHELGAGEPVRKLDLSKLSREALVLTNYETVRNYQFSMATVDWGLVVLDEAQKAKNPLALQTRAIKALKAGFRIVATGTPVENDLGDLWSLVDIAHPGHLNSLASFRRDFAPGTGGGIEPARLQALVKRIKPTMLRRMKADILRDLPERREHVEPVEMSNHQQRAYQRVLGDIKASGGRREVVLQGLHHLRLVSVHPCLLESGGEVQVHVGRISQESPKLARVLDIVEGWKRSGEKGVLFAREKSVQRLLQLLLEDRFGTPVAIVNGETPAVQQTRDVPGRRMMSGRTRKQILDRFQASAGFGMIILSPEAVGYGLTLTAANHVIHVTRLWNPAKEDQATDRVYRIGQTRDVHVHLPMSRANGFVSFDEVLHGLLEDKRNLARNVLHPVGNLDLHQDLLTKILG
jgi:hypothetical protein